MTCERVSRKPVFSSVAAAPTPPPFPFTFVQPIAEPVEDAALFASGNQAYGSTLHRRAVVDVVFKNEDLQTGERRGMIPFCSDGHTCWQVKVSHTQ